MKADPLANIEKRGEKKSALKCLIEWFLIISTLIDLPGS